jgi:hypothetical protein
MALTYLRELTREHEANSRLDLTAAERRLLVVRRKLSSLGSDTFEDIVDKGVHDGHALLGDTSIGVHLLQHLVDVGAVRFHALLRLGGTGRLLGRLRGLLGGGLGHGYFGLRLIAKRSINDYDSRTTKSADLAEVSLRRPA